jgi:catechol 2,3-dioxygenase-like lactoylglutathione lyase family enzyme
VLARPSFHHLHLNSVDPDAAIDFYTAQFAMTSRTTWGGFPAVASPNDVLILFTKVSTAPPTAPQTALWHFGWHVTDARAALATYRGRADVLLLPLYTGDEDGVVFVSSDTWPGTGGVLGRSAAQIAEAKASGVLPTRSGGFGYIAGPDDAIVEYAGNYPSERFNHVHMFQEEPLCAEAWYQRHLGASALPGRTAHEDPTDAPCQVQRGSDRTFPALEQDGMFRTPSGGVAFGDVWLPWYMRQGNQPLLSTVGNLYDHIALRVSDLEGWIDTLRRDGITFLTEPYMLGNSRAVMIAGPSQEAIELVEDHD